MDGVLIRIYSGSSLVTTGTTGEGSNADGDRLFNLNAGSYTARLSMSGQNYTVVSPQSFTVTGDPNNDVFLITVELPTKPTATNPKLCRCSGYFLDLNGAPMKGVSIAITGRVRPTLLGDDLVASDRLQILTNGSGYGTSDLIRKGIYSATVEGYDDLALSFRVPDTSSANLPDVLFPYITAVQFSPGASSIVHGATVDITTTVIYRSGLQMTLGEFEGTLPVRFVSSNESVASTSVVGGKLRVTALVAGSTTITAERVTDGASVAITIFPEVGSVTGSLAVIVT